MENLSIKMGSLCRRGSERKPAVEVLANHYLKLKERAMYRCPNQFRYSLRIRWKGHARISPKPVLF
ncbi:uncharacterized protein J3R85_006508 [Psidium guajava]|nr:uncharacterized protein J3R85_006508 [Psidium guajava]